MADRKLDFEGALSVTRIRFLVAGLLIGIATLVGHVLILPPGWLGSELAWIIAAIGGLAAGFAGYRGFGPVVSVAGASSPALALALRGEFWLFYFGCFDGVGCNDPPPNRLRYTLLLVVLSVGVVLTLVTVGYGVGDGLCRVRNSGESD